MGHQACIQKQDGMQRQIYDDEFTLPSLLTSTTLHVGRKYILTERYRPYINVEDNWQVK